jgi:hypothetical protein
VAIDLLLSAGKQRTPSDTKKQPGGSLEWVAGVDTYIDLCRLLAPSETLPSENRQAGGDAVQNTFEVDIDHLLPILDTELVSGATGSDRGRIDSLMGPTLAVFKAHWAFVLDFQASQS